MKKIISLFLVILLSPMAALSAPYEEGKHYSVISEKATSKPEVREYFSYYCPACRGFEPLIYEIKSDLPDGVKLEKNHVDFLRGASPQVQQSLTKASVVAQQLKMEDKLNQAIFNYIHQQRAVFTSEKDIRNLFVLNGVDGEQFDKLMNSFSVNSKAKQLKKNQDTLSKKRALTGVPTIVVNGKYKIDNSALNRDDYLNDYKKLVQYLLSLS